MDYQKLLEYYLTSEEWNLEKTMFFESWRHCYDLYEGTPDWGMVYPCSEIYLEYERRIEEDGNNHELHLTDGQFQKYFDKRYSSEQRFSVIFALWWGLNELQVKIIADLRQARNCSRWLNYFLCNPAAQPNLSIQELNCFQYKGNYLVRIYDQKPETPDKPQYRTIPFEDISHINTLSARFDRSSKEIRLLIERKIHYEEIIGKITHGNLNGTTHDLDRIVQMVVDIQFKEGTVTLGRVTLPAEKVAHQVLQLHQHEVEFIVETMAKHPNAPSSDEQLLASLYSTVSSWAALHHHSTQCR